jgi:hypothetical protein
MKKFRFACRAPAVALALACALAAPAAVAEQNGPFAGFSGRWAGGGAISMADGSSERIHCRAQYSVGSGGHRLQQTLRCASDSYKLDISANVVSQGSTLSGSWSESNHGESGSISGRISGSLIRAQVAGGTFSAGLGISTQGASQSVTITPRAGTEVRSVSISLRRG